MAAATCRGVLAAIHAPPAPALFRPALVRRLHGVEAGSDLFLPLRHRAAPFLAAVVACAWAVVRPETRRLAAASVGLGMASFLPLYWSGGSPPALRGVALGDLAALPFLAFAVWRAFSPG